jgi:hypothetical protein
MLSGLYTDYTDYPRVFYVPNTRHLWDILHNVIEIFLGTLRQLAVIISWQRMSRWL